MTELRDEIDLDAWAVDDLPDTFADEVLDSIDAGRPSERPETIVATPQPVSPASRRTGRIAIVAATLAAAAAVALWWPSSAPPPPSEVPTLVAADVSVTAEDDAASWRFLSTSAQSAIAEQTAGRVRWETQRGVPLTVQTPAGHVATTRADFSLEILDMSLLAAKKELALGTVLTGSIAALVYMHSGDVRVENAQGELSLSSPRNAVMSDGSAPRELAVASAQAPKAQSVLTTPKPNWAAARVGIEKALASRESHPADAPDREEVDPAAAPEEPPGGLSKEYLRDTVQEQVVPLVKECYDNLLEKNPATDGRMVLQFTIMGDESVGGIVDEMDFGEDSEISDEDFRECLSETMMSTVFDPPEGGGKVHVTYPFIFATDPMDLPEPKAPEGGRPPGSAATPN
jgi:hypothetical protein